MKYFFGLFIMLFLCLLDCTITFLRLSLVMCVCVCLTGSPLWLVISGLGGIFCDLYLDTFPFYTFLYLYISLGCVYIKNLTFKTDMRVFFITSFVFLGIFGAVNAGLRGFLYGATNSFAAPLFYVFLKKEMESEKI